MRQYLRQSQLFAQLDDRSLEEIGAAASLKNSAKNELIFYQGDVAYAFFIVATGKVKVFKMSPEGKEQILLIANPGDSFAEAALFSGGRFPASAQALEDSVLIVISRERFVALIEHNPDIAVNLIARLAGLLRKMTSLVEELSLTDVTTRLAHYLADQVDGSPNGPVTIQLEEKKGVLAAQLGTIPETLSRSFARLVREKMIVMEGAEIRILDLQRMRELAGID
ncbi:MAG: Crp/Fnr family transcriptional regulator [bacterium]|nr:Crp/Fnr family transcriptional regulator [bacterium]